MTTREQLELEVAADRIGNLGERVEGWVDVLLWKLQLIDDNANRRTVAEEVAA
jgi:hypothetical protein